MNCLGCNSETIKFLDLGKTPLANNYLQTINLMPVYILLMFAFVLNAILFNWEIK